MWIMVFIRKNRAKAHHIARKLVIAVLIGLAFMSLILSFPAIAQEENQDEKEVEVFLDPPGSHYADFTVSGDITIYLAGNVTVNPDLPKTVYIGINAPNGWETSISPEEVYVIGSTTIQFEGEVRPSTSSDQKEHVVYVWASVESRDYSDIDWTSNPSTAERASSIVEVIQNRIQLIKDITEHTVLPDSTLSYDFTVTNVATVTDTFFIELEDDEALLSQGWTITASADSLTLDPGETGTFTVTQYIPEDVPEGDYDMDVKVYSSGHSGSRAAQTLSTSVRVPDMGAPIEWMLIFMVGFVITGVSLAALLGATEYGYLTFISLFLPLYVRLKKKDVLSHFTRGQIFGYIQANPGAHYNAIIQDLDLKNGVGAYHLKVLEREGYIKSMKEGIYKRFYPASMRVPERRLHLSRVQRDILREIQKHPGVTQKQVSKLLDESKQVVNYHVKILESAGLVRLERSGRETYLFAHRVRYEANGDVYEVVEDAGAAKAANI
ncbi:MAG: winged helix-turn-helix transcriptional regulator [Thermoplasmata archaeon]|nr:MAG: winged helix-turn-helix transcriptional regulator [Thermoplasmata archaeon]